ncbi:F-box protein [Hirschfeldia incana]|nr:F-box protein [Hirschfeldia incana]KAJ0241851.1 F-box protein [Hirschfeldia incana]
MGKVNKGMSKKKESAWLGRWTQLGNELKLHDHSSGGDSKELIIRAEDKEVLPFPMFKVSHKRDNTTTKDEVGSSKANIRMPWMHAQGDVQEKTTQNLLELMRPVRFYATVDSVQRVSGEMEEGGGHHRQLLKGSMKLKGKIFGRYLDLFPNVDHHLHKGGGARLESLESSKDTQEEKKNESSGETDTLEMDTLQMLHLSGSIASSSTKGKGRKGDSAVPTRTVIPDMNEEPPVVMDGENSVDGGHEGETSNSATQSMNVDHFLSRDCKRVRLEQEPEASSRWVKRLKRNSFDDSSGHDETKSLMKIEEEGNNNNNNNLFLEILKSGINNLQPRNQEPVTPQIKGGGDEVTLMHPWIQRWCKKKDEAEGEDVRFEEGKEKEMEEKKQYPSIAAMALMGKALTGLNPYGLRKTDSLMVWNARDLR